MSFTKKKRKSKGKKKTPCTHAFLSHCFSISFAIILTIQRELIYPSFNEFNLSDKDDLWVIFLDIETSLQANLSFT